MGLKGRGTGFSSESVDMMRPALCIKSIGNEDLFVLGARQPRCEPLRPERVEAPVGRLVKNLLLKAPGVGLEPTTLRLTAECSAD